MSGSYEMVDLVDFSVIGGRIFERVGWKGNWLFAY